MTTRVASCSCGQIKVTCEGEPVRTSMCFCFACQKRTGSAYGAQARYAADHVQIEGTATQWLRTGDSGGHATLCFCPTCGSTVYWMLDGLPNYVAVAIGAFADSSFPAPTVSVYEARRHTWTPIPESIVEHFD